MKKIDGINCERAEDGRFRVRITTMGCALTILAWTVLLVLFAVCWKIVAIAWVWATT